MREIALATGLGNKSIIEFMHANLQTKVDFCKNIITTYSDNNFVYLLFAFDEIYTHTCEAILKDLVVDYIETVYKPNYLKTKIKNPLCNTLIFNAYIKVLSLFDKSTDETALKNILNFNQTFFMDSFLEFRLNPLKEHWNNLASLSSDNATLFSSGTFLDVIRFLVNTMDNTIYKVKVVINGEHCSIYNMKNKNAKVKKIAECNGAVDLIENVLNSCPNYIDVYLNSNQQDEAVSFLSNIFSNRLKIYMKN